ncbi:MAG: hypothetical protein HOP10_04690 [Chitinophagaceae bacterium]|nr:hypothetical protein [Chitinophagaceae bacterium]
MKVQRNPNPMPVKKTPATKDRSAKLSSDAFYLIALATLLKKETGGASLLNYLFPKEITRKERTAA